jgi:thiosulfate/3-mercaptopyruvate sulfurtransferase
MKRMEKTMPTLILSLILLCSLYVAPTQAAPVLVDGDWVAARLDDPAVVLVDTSDAGQYSRFHLPGALHLPYEALLKPVAKKPYATRLDDAELTRLLGDLGIRRTHHVIIYDDTGALNAGRLFWELERIGHPQVSVLDGGLVAWILQGRRVVSAPAERKPVAYGAAGGGRNNEATLADVKRAADGAGPLLLDVRTQDEYVGDPRQPRSGHVPGARLWPWEQAVDGARGYKRANTATLRQSLERAGATNAKQPIIAYCRTGHRAAQTYLTLRSLGYEDVRLYANSMMEYATDPAATVKSGALP